MMRRVNGFSLAEVVVALGVGSIAVLISTTILVQLYGAKRRADFLVGLSDIRVSFQRAILDGQSWDQSRLSDSMMNCFSGAQSTCLALNGMAARDFKIFSGSQLLFDSTDALAGYTLTGQPCSTFSTTSATCLLKPHVTWQAQCNLAADPTCLSPLILVRLNYTTSSEFDLTSINLASYGFQISKATFAIKASDSCAGAIPICSGSQAAICENSNWTCEEFGL